MHIMYKLNKVEATMTIEKTWLERKHLSSILKDEVLKYVTH